MTAMDDAERFHPESAAQWRDWLATHHGRGSGVWLVFWRHESSGPVIDYESSVLEALCFGWIDSTRKVLDDDRVVMWFAPRRARSTWVASNKARVARLEAEGRMQPAGRALVDAAKANGMWTLFDEAEAGVAPDDLAARLATDDLATSGWRELSGAQRRRHLMELALARSTATRERRLDGVVAACRSRP